MKRYEVEHRAAGHLFSEPELVSRAWDELIESQVLDRKAWCDYVSSTITSLDRIELRCYDDSTCVAFAAVVRETKDPHVQECMTVLYNFTLPEYRGGEVGKSIMRAVLHLARSLNFKTLMYSHREGVGKYSITYRRIHGWNR